MHPKSQVIDSVYGLTKLTLKSIRLHKHTQTESSVNDSTGFRLSFFSFFPKIVVLNHSHLSSVYGFGMLEFS